MVCVLNYDCYREDTENQVISALSVPSIFKISFSMKAKLPLTCQIKTTTTTKTKNKKKQTSSFGNEPPLTRPPDAAANHTVRQLHLISSQSSSYRCLPGCSCGPMNPAGNESAQGGMLGHVALLLCISFA